MSQISSGAEWVVDAEGCDEERLRSPEVLAALFARIVTEMGLQPAGETAWRVFPPPGGITGLLLLTESHLACHTFPELRFAAFNLYCCRARDPWPWAERLAETLDAKVVVVRALARGPGAEVAPPPPLAAAGPASRR